MGTSVSKYKDKKYFIMPLKELPYMHAGMWTLKGVRQSVHQEEL